MSYVPGSKWRLRANHPDGLVIDLTSDATNAVFDEVVVDRWLHVEQMSEREYWMQVGDAHLWIEVDADGFAKNVTVTDGIGKVAKDFVKLECSWRPKKKGEP